MQQQGTPVDQVTLELDYNIIEHFSKHLYSSPTKAIEELVVNGYDAAATKVNVFLPGTFTQNVIIWDNGSSMNIEGLKNLWRVADSPKNSDDARTVDVSGSLRKVIGKFGIGKIASYTLGTEIYHVCKSNGEYLSVGVNYSNLLTKKNSTGKTNETSPIFRLTEDEAKTVVESVFSQLPNDFLTFFNSPNWTCAVIEQIKPVDLSPGRIKWVLGNGMPLQPQFSVFLNEDEIVPNIVKNGQICEWNFGQQEVKDQIESKWKEAIKNGLDDNKIEFGEEVGLNPRSPNESIPYVHFPSLGKVWGVIRLYNRSLLNSRSSDHGRSHGFFIMVRDRLINQEDAQFFLNDPSFATFYSSQYILYADGLDEDLLADRERVQEASVKSKELTVLQRAVYLALAAQQRKELEKIASQESVQHRLPVESPEYFLQPLAALWVKSGSGQQLGFDFREPKIKSKALGNSYQVSDFSTQDGFTVNSDHPYYQNLTRLVGNGKQSQKIVKEFEVIAVSEKLFEGYLYEIGVDEKDIEKIMSWRDEMYRKIAKTDKQNLNQLAESLRESSHKSGAVFENSIVEILNSIGFIAERDGASGKKDGYLKAFCGDGSYKLTFEAKGCSTGSVANDAAETGGANNHRIQAGADHAVIIARKFAGFDKPTEIPAILGECKSMGAVSIMETEALIEIAFSVKEHSYSLESLKDVFITIESPSAKSDRIKKLQNPLDDFNYVEFLDFIWREQVEVGDGDAVALRPIWQKNYKTKNLTEDDILRKTEALRTLVYPLIQFELGTKQVALMQTPENIIQLINNRFSNR